MAKDIISNNDDNSNSSSRVLWTAATAANKRNTCWRWCGCTEWRRCTCCSSSAKTTRPTRRKATTRSTSASALLFNAKKSDKKALYRHSGVEALRISYIVNNFRKLRCLSRLYAISCRWFQSDKCIFRKNRKHFHVHLHHRVHHEDHCVWLYDASGRIFEKRMEFTRFYNRRYWVSFAIVRFICLLLRHKKALRVYSNLNIKR